MNYGVEIESYSKDLTIGLYGGKFLPFHNGHLSCILQASEMVDVLFVAVGYDDEYDKVLCEGTKFEWVSNRQRERCFSKALKNYSNIRVLSQYERRSDDYMNDVEVTKSTQELIQKVGGKIDLVFSSESEYDPYFTKYYPNSKHVILNESRSELDISATSIREKGVYESWNYLPREVQESYVKRVCLCGVESTGKSTLTKLLASAYNTNYVEEYGRTYYDELNGYHDISEPSDSPEIAISHAHYIKEAAKESNKLLLIDTDIVYTDFFHINNYGQANEFLENIIRSGVCKIDKYIYLEPHNPHELDGSRRPVTDKMREENNRLLKDLYAYHGIELEIIDEKDDLERFNKCVSIINGLFT